MSAVKKIVDKKVLRELVPLNELSPARFEEISGKIAIEEVRAGKYLFRINDRDNQAVFLLGGEVSLLDDKRVLAGTIIAGSEESNYPIANVQPRALSARAAKKCVIARVDTGLLDAFLSWDQSNNAEVVAIGADENKDWMTRMLQSQAFEKIPPAKIQLLLLKMDAVQLTAGDTVISQGEDGDYFYTIESGKCAVTRRKTPQAKEKLLAELSSGDCFGEEALVSDVKRNATVTMLTDGVIMRLAKKDFVELLREPLVRYVNYEKAAVMVDEGAVWVDVRSAEDYDSGALEDSVNIPLSSLRMEMPELVFNVSYIICCESGHSGESAAFILSHNGFDVYVLRGGLQAIPENTFCPASDQPLAEALPADTNQELDEVVGHAEPASAAPVDADIAVRVAGLEQQVATLNSEKQQLESDLDSAQKQQASIERVVDEQKRLHELDKQQIAGSAAEHEKLRVDLQDEIQGLETRISEQTDKIDKLLAEKQAAVEMLDSNIEEWGRERIFFKSESDEAQLRIAEMLKQLEQVHEGHASNESGLQKELDEVTGKLNKKLENKEFQYVELKQSQSRLQGELEAIRINRDKLQEKLDNAIKDSASRQQENDALQAQLAGVSGKANEQVAVVQMQLDDMRRQLDEAKQQAADSLERLNNMQDEVVSLREAETRLEQEKQSAVGALERQDQEWGRERASLISGNEEAQQRIADLQKQLEQTEQGDADDKLALQEQLDELAGKTAREIENKESQCIELEQNLSRLQQELDAIHEDRDSFQQQLGVSSEEAASQQQEIETLKAQLAEISDSADGQLETVQIQLEAMRMQREDMHQQADERNTQIETMQVEMASIKAAEAKQEQEMSELARQNQELQQLLEQGGEDENARHSENEQLLIKARDDLAQKSNNEQELQGQVDRLRKKLEQTTSELQGVREAERTDTDSIREELHAERSARSAERAEMAARQRELKEQLAVVAAEHEENLANQDRTIEQARIEQMRETRLETESQFEELENKLKQAHDETRGLTKEQQQQYESTLDKLRTEMKELVQERDAALENQRATHENIKGADVSGGTNGDGQIQAEAVSVLQSELDEARKNAEVADRLRAEAEAACARIKDERDVLQKQVGNNLSLGNSLNVPALEQKPKQTNSAVFTALTPQAPSVIAPTWKIRAAMTGQRLRETSGAVAGKWPRLIRATAFCMVVMAGLVIGLKIFVDKSAVLDTQAQNDAGDFTSTPAAVGEESVSEPAADRQVFAPARPVAQDREEMELPPPPPAPRVTQTLERAETVEAPVPEEQHLVATGSFQDNLKDGGNAPLMMMLPAASFMMGSRGNSLNIDEGPQHEVSMSRFAVSKYEVTFSDYDRFARANGVRLPHDETWGRGDSPAINVSWKDAQAYVRWLSDQTGHSYHLPTEAQWEFAARAGTSTSYMWDVESESVSANCFDCGSEWDKSRTAPVGSFRANYFGLHDMGGNVQEWTEDCYRASYEGASADGGPMLIPECSQRVVRGGGYTSPITSLRSASRGQYDQDTRLDNLGFRVVRKY